MKHYYTSVWEGLGVCLSGCSLSHTHTNAKLYKFLIEETLYIIECVCIMVFTWIEDIRNF